MQCRAVLAHVWTIRPLLHHTVQGGASPHLDHTPLTVPHPVLYSGAGDVILHKQDHLHTTQDCWHGYIWTDGHCQLPLPNGATLRFHCYSIRSQTGGYLLVNAARTCPSPVQHEPRNNYAASCQRSFSAVQFHLCCRRHTFQDRQTYGSRNIGPAVSRGCCHSTNADCYMYTNADCYMYMYTR